MADVQDEVPGDLPLVDDLPGPDPDLARVLDPPGGDLGGDLAQVGLGGGQQVLAGAGALGGLERAAAGDQPPAGEVPGDDLSQVLLVNSDSCSGPPSAMSFLIAGWRRQVIRAMPFSWRRSLIRAE